jgi:antitoxin component HigA of HigAB toxin-antitoxin module
MLEPYLMGTEEETAIAQLILNELKQLRNDGGADTAAALFEIKDELDQIPPERQSDASKNCARIVSLLADAMALKHFEGSDDLWAAAIDAAQEWVWLVE